jgi:protein-S-isoprenylcysteine O-methyltransferase Ste14
MGVVPQGVGMAIILIAANAFAKVNTTIRPFEESVCLVTDGLFRVSRNPIYLGVVLTLLGTAVLMGSLTPYAVVLLFFKLMDVVFVRTEERMLEDRFGEAYVAYKQQVRRWI